MTFVSSGCRVEDFFMYFHYKSMVHNEMPGAWPVWTPGAWLAGFIKRTFLHCYTQNMKALGLIVSEKKIFYVFPIVSLWELMTHRGRAIFDPRGMVGRIYKEDDYTLLNTKYESSGPCGFGEEDFFYVFPMPRGGGAIWTLGARLAGFIKRTTIHCFTQNMKALGLVVSEKKIF